MTKEEKQLLLTDLCARLPYRVKVKYLYWDENKGCEYPVPMILDDINSDGYIRFHGDIEEGEGRGYILTYLPYLRPMSSMTEEERTKIASMAGHFNSLTKSIEVCFACLPVVDYCCSRHLDIHGLIEKGLALEAKEGMY